jgi:hypothetical protein
MEAEPTLAEWFKVISLALAGSFAIFAVLAMVFFAGRALQ